MARLSLKQIQDGSQNISGTGIITVASGSKLQMADAPTVGNDLANKTYVDSVAAGLDPKESVVVISATGAVPYTGTFNIDGVSLTAGDRILLASQGGNVATGHTGNGIWVVAAGAWARATDHDGTPGNEVSLGNFTFVEEGTQYSGSGWVLADTDAAGATISPANETQQWTQFSANGAYTAGDGLQLTGNQFSIVDTAAGAGLTFSNGIFDIGAGNGITVNADDIAVIYGSAVNTAVEGNTSWSITAGSGMTGDASGSLGAGISSTLNVIAGTGIGVNPGDVYVDGSALAGTGISWTGGQFVADNSGDVTGVTAGAGLVGGGSSGFLQLDVELTTNGGLTLSAAGDAGTIEVDEANLDYSVVAGNLDGAGLVVNGTTNELDVNLAVNGGLTFSGDTITADFANLAAGLDGTGLVVNGTELEINPGTGLGIDASADTVYVDGGSLAGTGIQWVGGQFQTSGVISGVTAGAGLVGGGSSGFIQIDAELTVNGGLTFSAAGDAGTIEVDTAAVAGTLDGEGLVVNSGTNELDVNTGAGLTISTDKVAIDYLQASAALAGDGLGVAGDGLSIVVNGGTGIGVDVSADTVYVDGSALAGSGISWIGDQFVADNSGDVTGVTAGAGLVGGGVSGFLQLDVELTNNGGLTFSASGDAGTLEVDAAAIDGAGLIANANGIELDVNLGVNGGLTFSGDTIIVDTANIDFAVINTGITDKNVAASVTTADGDSAMATTIQATPLGYVHVYVNGDLQYLTGATATGDCYFSGDGGTTAKALTAIAATDTLHWNGSNAGFQLAASDFITLSYET